MLNAILPIFLLIVIGFALKHYRVFSEAFWNDAEKLAYFVLFPSLLVAKMSVADLSGSELIPLMSTIWLGLALISLITFAIKPFLEIEDASFTSVFQGSVRFNTFIGFALVESLFGNSGLITAVIIAAILIPALNFLVVIVLHRYGTQNQKANFFGAIKQIIKNPLIIGCAIGISLNLSGLLLVAPLQKTIDIIGSTALPIGLIAVGAALIFKDLKTTLSPILIASLLKFVLYPVIIYALVTAVGFDRQTQQIAVIFCALPTASASYIIAKNMGGDAQLMTRIITLQTIFSSATLSVWFLLLGV
jgi:predicted permease